MDTSSTAKVSLAEIFHPWVRWEGPVSGFGNLSVAAAVGVAGIWKSRISDFGIRLKNMVWNDSGHTRSKTSVTSARVGSLRPNFLIFFDV